MGGSKGLAVREAKMWEGKLSRRGNSDEPPSASNPDGESPKSTEAMNAEAVSSREARG